MNIQELKTTLDIILEQNGVPYITSSPGIGKSDSVKQFAQAQAEKKGLEFYEGPENYDPDKFGFIDLRLATVDVIDLQGLPLINREIERTKFTRSPYIAEQGHGILFLDELPQAKAGNQAAISQLILDRRVGMHELGENWRIIAAGNRISDRAAVHKMPTQISNRLTHLELDFCIDVFSEYLHSNEVDEAAIAFAKFRPELLESFSADKDINCTPRSFISASKFLNAPENLQYALLQGTIGEGPAAEFIGFTQIYRNLPSFESFIRSPEKMDIPEKPDILYATIQMLANRVSNTTITKVNSYIDRLKEYPEYIVMFWKNALQSDVMLSTTPEYIKFSDDNKDLLI